MTRPAECAAFFWFLTNLAEKKEPDSSTLISGGSAENIAGLGLACSIGYVPGRIENSRLGKSFAAQPAGVATPARAPV